MSSVSVSVPSPILPDPCANRFTSSHDRSTFTGQSQYQSVRLKARFFSRNSSGVSHPFSLRSCAISSLFSDTLLFLSQNCIFRMSALPRKGIYSGRRIFRCVMAEPMVSINATFSSPCLSIYPVPIFQPFCCFTHFLISKVLFYSPSAEHIPILTFISVLSESLRHRKENCFSFIIKLYIQRTIIVDPCCFSMYHR